ncbi:hypothetical protein [Undibacterium sp. Di24W]|uniref:hypothetical protein n=1 Tax=Undibacterium sp. Di24W TaxID=3413033 RepID=UPI003BF2C113
MLSKNVIFRALPIVFACGMLFASNSGIAKSDDLVPSLCLDDESNLVSAWMGNTVSTESGTKNKRDGKIVSVCTDSDKAPFQKVVYRYGLPERVELEMRASESTPLYFFNRSTSAHTGEDFIFFKNGIYTYYVVIAGGQANGVTLRIYNEKKLIFNRFSGIHDGEDFVVGPAEVDLKTRKSKHYQIKKPAHNF